MAAIEDQISSLNDLKDSKKSNWIESDREKLLLVNRQIN